MRWKTHICRPARPLVLLLVAIFFLAPGVPASRTQASGSAVQMLFLGDKECGDIYSPCLFPKVVAHHRYLHVILHEYAGDVEWRIQTSPDDCTYDAQDIGGYVPVPNGDFLETVIDLVVTANGQQALERPVCYRFRGLHGYGAMYYTAYFDDSPVPDGQTLFPRYEAMAGRPYLPDIDVQFIHESPSYSFAGSPNGPKPGQVLRYSAHIGNPGALPVDRYRFRWSVDGNLVRAGASTAPIEPDTTALLSLRWRWDGRPHTLQLHVIPSGEEISTANDTLSIRTNALKLGFWVEESASRYFEDGQWEYCGDRSCSGSNSLDDWLQHNVRTWNHMFAVARDNALAPSGIADRVRVDKITVVPDGALPLHGGIATNHPDTSDHSVDLEWGLPAAGVGLAYLRDRDGPFNIDYGMLHELSHARSLTDIYRFDIPATGPNVFDVHAADGSTIFDPAHPLDPTAKLRAFVNYAGDILIYRNAEHDLMSCTCTPYYSAYHAVVLNRLRGRRAQCGNTNPPCNIGDWFLDIPPVNRLRVVAANGQALPTGSTVRLFFDSSRSYNGHTFRQQDGQVLTSGTHGEVVLPGDPFHARGSTDTAAHNDLLIEVQTAQSDMVCVQEPSTFNLAYWEGYRDVRHPAVFTLRLGRQIDNSCNLSGPVVRVNEPFATSPFASTLSLTHHSKSQTMFSVHLVDDASPAHAMDNRKVEFYSGNRLLGRATTDTSGNASIALARIPSDPRAVDLTDNRLQISLPVSTPRR